MASSTKEWANGRVRAAKMRQNAFAFLSELQGGEGVFDFRHVSAEGLHGAVSCWINQGYAITLGRTSDGGALGVKLHANGETKAQYFGSVSELEDFFSRLAATGGGPVDQQP